MSLQAQAQSEAEAAALRAALEQQSTARQRLDDMLTVAEAVRAINPWLFRASAARLQDYLRDACCGAELTRAHSLTTLTMCPAFIACSASA